MSKELERHANHPRPVRMVDIAQEVGVSRATASLVLSGKAGPPRISEATCRKIRETAERMGYRPNELARAVVTGVNPVLGFLTLGGLEQPFRLLNGALAEAEERGHLLKVMRSPGSEAEGRGIAANCIGQRLAGLVVCRATQMPLTGFWDELDRCGIPAVIVDDFLADAGRPARVVASEDRRGMRQIVDHLADLGHRRIAYCGKRGDTLSAWRAASFREALADRGLPVTGASVFDVTGWETLDAEIDPLLRADPLPTALAFYGDEYAVVALRALRRRGMRVPEEISVVGYGGLFPGALSDPPLTTVAQPFEAIGQAAARLLLENQWEGTEDLLLDAPLIVRESTGPTPGRR